MQAQEFLVAICAAIIVVIIVSTALLLVSLRRRRRSQLTAAPNPSAAAAHFGDNWFVSKNDQQFGPITFDQLRTYARDGLVTRTDLIWRAGAQAWMRAQDIQGLFPLLPPPLPPAPAVRRRAEIALSAHDRAAAPPVSEVQALRHVTADALRHAAGQGSDPLRWAPERAAIAPDGDFGSRRRNYFARHWRGELSLPVSYWINGILAGVAAVLVVAAIHTGVDFRDDFQPGLALGRKSSSGRPRRSSRYGGWSASGDRRRIIREH